MQALMPSIRLQASLAQAQKMKLEASQPDTPSFTAPASIDRLELRFEGKYARTLERARVHDLIRKCIVANNSTDPEHLPDLTPKAAFKELSKGFADSFIQDPKASPALKQKRAAYQYLVGIMAKGLKVAPATLKSHGDLKQAYLDRYKKVAGEAAVLTSLRLAKDDNQYWGFFDRYVEKQFDDVIEKGFRSRKGMTHDVLSDEFSYANGIVRYLHDAIIGANPVHESGKPNELVVLKRDVVNKALGIKIPDEDQIKATVQKIQQEIKAIPRQDPMHYFKSIDIIKPTLQRELPEWFSETSKFVNASLSRLNLELASSDSLKSKVETLKTALENLSYDIVRNKMKKSEPQTLIQAFGLDLPSSDPAALKRFFNGKY